MPSNFQIMDVTLRDGSYAINFQFSEYETEMVAKEIEKSGIAYIEIGHGMGLNASSPENGVALCSDTEYMIATKRGTQSIKFGMFCIPGVAELKHLRGLAENGGSFVRIGTNVTEVKQSEAFIKEAKRLGLEVMANYMKSYAVTPEQFAENVKLSESYGADVVYVVDSAGSMNYADVNRYYEAIRKCSNIRVGFHGHNNLGLAVANTMYAAEIGYDLVDTSMLGMGRSSGNAATELVVANLIKQGYTQYELKKIIQCADRLIKPMWKHQTNALDLYCGIAEFHTSYMKYIHKYASKYRVNPVDLILAYSKYDKVNLDEQRLDKIASEMAPDNDCVYSDYAFHEYIGDEQKIKKNKQGKWIGSHKTNSIKI